MVENLSVEKIGSTSEVVFTWYQKNGLEWKEIASAPSNVGQYKVVATLPVDESYKNGFYRKRVYNFKVNKLLENSIINTRMETSRKS